MKRTHSLLTAAGVSLAAITSAHAGVTFFTGGSLTAWNGTPTYTSVVNANLSGASTGQGDATITGSYGLMSEIFTPSSSFTLGSFSMLCQVNNNTTYQVHLYDLGPANTVPVGASASYTPGTDLFSGLSLALSTTGGEVQGTFALSGADQVSLLANEQYALEVWTPNAAGASAFLWYRGAVADPGGQMFSAPDNAGIRQTLNLNGQAGGAPRTGALALYTAQVPEPSTFALAGLGVATLLAYHRRKA